MKKDSFPFRIFKKAIFFFYKKMKIKGSENLPDEPVIIVANHAQMNGPIACELYMPKNRYTWCAGEMMKLREVPKYAYQDFWRDKPSVTKPFYKALSLAIAPFSVFVFNSANTIAVYHDRRIISTFKKTIALLEEGNNIVIFPEHSLPYNDIVYDFQTRFIDIAKIYYERRAKRLSFVPLYIAPRISTMAFGKPISFSPDADIKEERERISKYLMDEITRVAKALPRHTVVPYRNIPKRLYPKSKEDDLEKARR